jgi:hypothetical protein
MLLSVLGFGRFVRNFRGSLFSMFNKIGFCIGLKCFFNF